LRAVVSEYRFPKTVRDVLRSWGFREDGSLAGHASLGVSSGEVLPMILIVPRTGSWGATAGQAGILLATGVMAVCVLDPTTESVAIYPSDEGARSLKRDEELTFPDLLPGFSVRVGEFFV
jgi:hypothetical protein